MDKLTRHRELCKELTELYAAKNHDYGDSFSKTYEEFGAVMAAIRLQDKLERFKRLIFSDSKVKDESIIDTLLDMANYSLLTIMEMENIGGNKYE